MIVTSQRRWPWQMAILGVLAACSSVPDAPEPRPQPAQRSASPAQATPATTPMAPPGPRAASSGSVPASFGDPILRPSARWWPVEWEDLPGWPQDRSAEVWTALVQGCQRPAAGWATLCSAARATVPGTDAEVRDWLEQRLQPYRIEGYDGADVGLMTGYYEPLVAASRLPQNGYTVPLYSPPADRLTRKPYWSRQQIDTLPEARAALRGRELAYVADPLDALILQIQGSGRLLVTEPDGSRKTVRVAFAGHNDLPYKSVGRWLIEQRELRLEQASWPGIKAWAQRNPRRVNEMLWSNPRVVFFREEPLPDPNLGPRGAQGVPLTPGRSIAVDPQSIPYGTPVWLDTTEPLTNTPLRRLVMAQDTGSAITGAVRGDYFWGWGDVAEQQAGRMKQPLRAWALWPRTPG